MDVSIATDPGSSAPNEDWAAGTPNLAVVLDGLSTAGLDTGCRHGVPWYVAQLGCRIVAALSDPGTALPDGLGAALEQVAALHPECDLRNPGTPSATVSILREEGDLFTHLVLADSPIVFDMGDEFVMVTDLRVDDVVHDLRAETEQYATGSPDHVASVRRMVTAQRQLRNTDAGYWVAASAPDAAAHAFTGSVVRSAVRAAAVMSDGVSRLVTEYGMASWADVFRILEADGAREVLAAVRKVEATDPDGRRWPRFKAGDDATVVYCSL